MEGFESPVYSKNVIEFATVANEYCLFMEKSEGLQLKELVDKLHRLLPFLYLKASLLPSLEDVPEEYNEKYVTEADYNLLHEQLLNQFGQYNFYDEVFDVLRQENDEPAEASLAENFADLYQDIKDFVMLYRIGTEEVMLNAIDDCKNAFETYWGQKLVNSLRALHQLRYGMVDLDNVESLPGASDENENDWF